MSEQKPSEIRAEVYDYIHSLGFNITHGQREGLSKILKKLSSPLPVITGTSELPICSSCQMKIIDDMILEPGDEDYDEEDI